PILIQEVPMEGFMARIFTMRKDTALPHVGAAEDKEKETEVTEKKQGEATPEAGDQSSASPSAAAPAPGAASAQTAAALAAPLPANAADGADYCAKNDAASLAADLIRAGATMAQVEEKVGATK